MTKPDTPFPKHWRYYIFIKWALIVAAVVLGLEIVRSVLTRWDRRCPNPRLRPYLAGGCARCWRRSSLPRIEELTGDDYSEAQQEAWAAAAEDEEAFGKKLAGELTLIATMQNSPVGFRLAERRRPHRHALRASERGRAGRRRRCWSMRWKSWRAARGAKSLTVDASDTAEPISSESAATSPSSATPLPVNGEWLANTTMQKTLADSAAPGAPS